jgi:drug/metabolite transporter (DMT)-like permease
MNKAGDLPLEFIDKVWFLFHRFANIWILSGFLSAFLASLCWMAAMTKFELSFAYPFMSLSFVFVLVSSMLFFGEAFA